MRLSVKCNMMQLKRKLIRKVHVTYNLAENMLEDVESMKFIGVSVTHDLRWTKHVSNICTKVNRMLAFLKCNLTACPQDVKVMAYRGLVHLILEYASSV